VLLVPQAVVRRAAAKRAGVLPYVALAGGIASCTLGYAIFWI
jgi:hypothetical protein